MPTAFCRQLTRSRLYTPGLETHRTRRSHTDERAEAKHWANRNLQSPRQRGWKIPTAAIACDHSKRSGRWNLQAVRLWPERPAHGRRLEAGRRPMPVELATEDLAMPLVKGKA